MPVRGPTVRAVKDDQPGGLPTATAVGVFVLVVIAIAAVLIAQRIPHALRPTLQQPPHTSVVTITTTPTAGG